MHQLRRKGMRIKQKQMAATAICIAAFAISAAAQTVTGSGTTNTVPVFTGTSTVGNSPISVSGGNGGIGTTTPGAKLQVIGSTNLRGTTYLRQNSNGTAVRDAYNGNAFFGDNSATNGIAVNPNGQVGIGTTSPATSLQVVG